MANASLEDCQLFAQSEILQRDLFIAAKEQEDHPKKREDCVQHEAESVSASSLKINRFRNRWNSGEAQAALNANLLRDAVCPRDLVERALVECSLVHWAGSGSGFRFLISTGLPCG